MISKVIFPLSWRLFTRSVSTVVKYYEASEEYGMKDLKLSTREWLLFNLTMAMCNSPQHLRHINIPLMVDLVSSHDVYVVQTECCLYRMLKCVSTGRPATCRITFCHHKLTWIEEFGIFCFLLFNNAVYLSTDLEIEYIRSFSDLFFLCFSGCFCKKTPVGAGKHWTIVSWRQINSSRKL